MSQDVKCKGPVLRFVPISCETQPMLLPVATVHTDCRQVLALNCAP